MSQETFNREHIHLYKGAQISMIPNGMTFTPADVNTFSEASNYQLNLYSLEDITEEHALGLLHKGETLEHKKAIQGKVVKNVRGVYIVGIDVHFCEFEVYFHKLSPEQTKYLLKEKYDLFNGIKQGFVKRLTKK